MISTIVLGLKGVTTVLELTCTRSFQKDSKRKPNYLIDKTETEAIFRAKPASNWK